MKRDGLDLSLLYGIVTNLAINEWLNVEFDIELLNELWIDLCI